MIECSQCGWQPVPEEELPVKLPEVEKYQPTDTGDSPLASIESWVETRCPKCKRVAKRETDTMPNWAGSSWYFLRYIDPKNNQELASPDKLKYWLPVDWYNGGMEHTTLHLLYSRFWHKFLFDLGIVPTLEPYAKRTSHGVVLGPDGRRMSKSRGNVINPDDIVGKYGADTLRLYEMFIGPFDQTVTWNQTAVEGVHRFLKRVWILCLSDTSGQGSTEIHNKLAKLVSKIDYDLENLKFNTAVSSLMEFVNYWSEHQGKISREQVGVFLKTLAPMAPFIAEELYHQLFGLQDKDSIHSQAWPELQAEMAAEEDIVIIVQVNGVVRERLNVMQNYSLDQIQVEQLALQSAKVKKYLKDGPIRTIFVPGKIINFVTQ